MTLATIENVRNALSYISPDMEREEWAKIGMSVKDGLNGSGFAVFDEWSKGGTSYNKDDVKDTWNSIKAGGKITIGTLFYLASQNGFEPDRTAEPETKEQRLAREKLRKEKADKEAKATESKAKAAAGKVKTLCEAATPAQANHPYLVRKGVKPVATLLEIPAEQAAHILGYAPKSDGKPLAGRLLIAQVKINGKLSTAELIDEEGRKSAIAGGAKSCGYWSAQPLPAKDDVSLTFAIGEGVATVLTAHEAKNYFTIAALSASNIPKVAKYIKDHYPTSKIIILADVGNGQKYAEQAASVTGAALAIPSFTPEQIQQFQNTNKNDKPPTDFNDLHLIAGLGAVLAQISVARNPPSNIIEINKVDKPAFKLVQLSDLMAREYKPNWLIKGLIEQGNIGLIFGNSASGKSLFVQDVCFCIAAGIYFKGKATEQGSVVYIAGEGFSGLQKRFKALTRHYGVETSNLYLSEQPAAFMDISSADDVRQAIDAIGNVKMIVIDTLHRNMGVGDENSSKDFAQFLNNIDTFLKPIGAAVLIIHHSGHDAKERARGSSAIRAAMDIEYQVLKDSDLVTVKNTKMKDFEPPEPLSFKMVSVDIGLFDEDGESITSVILEPTDYAPSKSKPLNSRQQDVLAELHKAIEQHGIVPDDGIKALFIDSPQNIPNKVVHLSKWRELAYKVIDSDIQDTKKKSFQYCTKSLKEAGKIGFYDNHVWVV